MYYLSPGRVLDGAYPRLVDEWQDAPVLWDKARRVIDDNPSKGLFICTGSAVPPRRIWSNSSLAGRHNTVFRAVIEPARNKTHGS